jgi:hypothetical protein
MPYLGLCSVEQRAFQFSEGKKSKDAETEEIRKNATTGLVIIIISVDFINIFLNTLTYMCGIYRLSTFIDFASFPP